MTGHTVKTMIIVGAGFSRYAGLPLTSKFTESMLAARSSDHGPSRIMVEYLAAFIHEVFGHSTNEAPESWPQLEDVFTCVDLSANSGHHLGSNFAPADLRTVRRAMLCRIIRMLEQEYQAARKRKGEEWHRLDEFFMEIDPGSVGFISMNWDTVVEHKLGICHSGVLFDYCCDAFPATIPEPPGVDDDYSSPSALRRQAARPQTISLLPQPLDRREVDKGVPIIKIHGSANWLYCDNCRQIYWFQPDQSNRIADQLVTAADLRRIRLALSRKKRNYEGAFERLLERGPMRCLCSDRVPLGTRIATFSYRKALDFPMFQRSWLSAEELLRYADKWVFIGYSLPPADFEFKYLLKRAQLARREPPTLVVVSGGGQTDVARTRNNYARFFGRSFRRRGFFRTGLTRESIKAICS